MKSPQKEIIFKSLATRLITHLEQSHDAKYVLQEEGEPRDLLVEPYLVYIAGDNQEVKSLFVEYLEEMAGTIDVLKHSLFMHVKAKQIGHIGTSTFNTVTKNEGMMDVTFDWYTLSLCNVVLSWRAGNENLLSTFVHSAVRVSGNKDVSDLSAPIGHGIGSKAFVMVLSKHNYTIVNWNAFWAYSAHKQSSPFNNN